MSEIRNFHEKLEKDLRRLSAEVQSRREQPAAKELSEREIIKQSLEIFQPASNQPAVSETPSNQVSAGQRASSFLPAYLSGSGGETEVKAEVELLVNIVFEKGIEKAIAEAKKKPPFIADAFHDALVDKILPELKKRGVI